MQNADTIVEYSVEYLERVAAKGNDVPAWALLHLWGAERVFCNPINNRSDASLQSPRDPVPENPLTVG